MSTLRISNIEAKSVPASATTDEKIKITNSSGDVLVFIDGKTSGITTVGINTTDGNIKFDANSNVVVTGIITATRFSGEITPTSLNVSGGVGVGDSIFHIGDDNTQIRFPANDIISFESNGSEKVRIDGNGLRVNTTVDNGSGFSAQFHNTGTSNRIQLTTANTGTGQADGAVIMIDSSSNMEILNRENTSLEFFTNNTQRLTLDNNGALRNVNGARSDFYNGSYDARGLHVEGVGSDRRGWISLVTNHSTSGESVLMFGKTRGTSSNARTIVAANDDLGVVHFSGADGVDLRRAAEIRAQVDGTPAVNKVGGRLMFFTTPNTTDASPVERFRIESDGTSYVLGDFGVGTNSPQSSGLTVENSSEARLRVRAGSNASNGEVAIRADGGNTQLGTWSDHDCKLVRNTAIQASIISNGIQLPDGKSINFGNTIASQHQLDDYEEGSYTPVMGGSGWSYSRQVGYYRKIGTLVHVSIWITGSGGPNDGSTSTVSLPFTSYSASSYRGGISGSWDSSNFDNTYTSGRNRSHLNSNTSTMQASFPFVDNGGWTSSGLVNSGLYNGFACQMSGSYISNS